MSSNDIKNLIYDDLEGLIKKNGYNGMLAIEPQRRGGREEAEEFVITSYRENGRFNVRTRRQGREMRLGANGLTKEEVWAMFLEAFSGSSVGGRRRRRSRSTRRSTRRNRNKRRGSRRH